MSVNILIVDDKPENIISLEALLKQGDINIISTTSPNEALRICWEQDICIALIDVQMPGMDGFELAETLKSNQRTRDILIIFVTAISKESKYAVKGLNAGAIDYLYKPLDPYITTAKVNSFIKLVVTERELKRKNLELEAFQKKLVEAKEQAEQEKRTKENFLANMSHEIRTPVNGIIGLTHLLMSTSLNDEQKQLADLLHVSSQSLIGVVNDVLDISKIESGKFKIVRSETNLLQLAKSIIELFVFRANEKNIHLALDISPDVPTLIMADALRLNQILMNLVSNGIKFTTDGSVTLSIKVIDRDGDTARIEFAVIDTGIGIASNRLNVIFDSFEQADDSIAQSYGGTGLGLSIVKKLAELKGGELSVTSTENEGSAFKFTNWYRVIDDKAAAKKIDQHSVELPKFNNIRVLLAEDNTVSQFMLTKILGSWNIEVDIAGDGEQAIQLLKEKDFNLVLMDTHMPKLSGYEAIHQIRTNMPADKKDIPIISLSAAILEEEQATAMQSGADDVLNKPFEPLTLYRKIESLLKKKQEPVSIK
ncbi:response regulator [Pedobacter sp. BS3]|uniref:response regulator n=1 Tax=Pedobacter sp. BS3 TaxID=2567937 RepID=UPI0011F05E4C|nr:response regulator [Pedobacter sp. BS3]TZF84031.1 response regulator [Pedobacter sp. BS3]